MRYYLRELFPKTYFYELSSNTFFNWDLKTTLDDIITTNGNKILLMNGPTDPSELKKIEDNGFPLKQVYSGHAQNIYILDTLKDVPPVRYNFQQIGPTINFDVEQLSMDRKYFFRIKCRRIWKGSCNIN